MNDPDNAARMLAALDTRKAKRIVEAARSEEQLTREYKERILANVGYALRATFHTS